MSFSSLKPKPKIFVGAAFFNTGKKPTSMYKRSAPKSSTRGASILVKSKVDPQLKREKIKKQEPPLAAPVKMQQLTPVDKVSGEGLC